MASVLDSGFSGPDLKHGRRSAMCSWAFGHLTLIVPLFIQEYKRVLVSKFNAGGDNPAMDYHPIDGGVEILLVTSC